MGAADFGNERARAFLCGKTSLVLHSSAFTLSRTLPGGNVWAGCCNYLVVSLISNCPMDCSYCFLQEYLANNPTLKVFTNVDELLREVAAAVDRHPERHFRIGTGELSDSLALDPLLGFSTDLVPFFAAAKHSA